MDNELFDSLSTFVLSNKAEYEELQNICIILIGKLKRTNIALRDLRFGLFPNIDVINQLLDETIEVVEEVVVL